MTAKPSYLGLLNAISNAEGDAECFLGAWAKTTTRDDVRSIINTVALREGEHAKAFAKRMCELGFDVMPKQDPRLEEKMAIASSCELSDLEKFQRLELGLAPVEGKPDIFASMLADSSIDIQTGALLGRYIAEERDSGRLFQSCRGVLESECAQDANATMKAAVTSTNGAAPDRLDRIEALLERLAQKLEA
ncbi:MAG: hypothetical protein ACKV2O_14880 [Acidimicrobiales bacterium]